MLYIANIIELYTTHVGFLSELWVKNYNLSQGRYENYELITQVITMNCDGIIKPYQLHPFAFKYTFVNLKKYSPELLTIKTS